MLWHLNLISLKLCTILGTAKPNSTFWYQFEWLWLRSQGYKKAKNDAVILLWTGMKSAELLHGWLFGWGRWHQRSCASMVNMDCFSFCSSCLPVFDVHEYHMDLRNESCSAGRLSCWLSCVTKTLMLNITRRLLNLIFFLPAILIGTIDFFHCTPLSQTLTLGGHRISTKQNPLACFFHTFHLIRMKFDVVMKQFKLNMLRLLLSKIKLKQGK